MQAGADTRAETSQMGQHRAAKASQAACYHFLAEWGGLDSLVVLARRRCPFSPHVCTTYRPKFPCKKRYFKKCCLNLSAIHRRQCVACLSDVQDKA
jgi:hypothetical protein